MAVLLQLALGGFPPLLPIVADHVRHEHLMDLVEGGFAAVALQHELDQVQVVERGKLPQPFEIGKLPREDMVWLDRFEGLRSKTEVHSVPGLRLKINRET